MLFVANIIKAQVPQTFTCNSIQVTNTITSTGVINASEINTSSTLTASDDISAQQDVNVTGNINLQGNLNLSATSTANIGGPVIFNNSLRAAPLGNGTGYQPVFVGPGGELISQSGILAGNPFPPSTACQNLNTPWAIGGNFVIPTGYTDFSAGTCDNVSFVLKSNNLPKIVLTGSTYNNNIGFGTGAPLERFHFTGGNFLLDENNGQNGNFIKMNIKGSTDNTGLQIETSHAGANGYNTKLYVNQNETKAVTVVKYDLFPNAGPENFIVYGDGQTVVGYQPGSANAATLNVNVNGGEAFNIFDQTNTQNNFSVKGNGQTNVGWQPGASNNAKLNINVNGGEVVNVYDQASNKVNFAVLANGRTYIGPKRPLPSPGGPHGDAMLSVDGKILARSVIVNIHNSVWPDYVFDKKYVLASLSEVKTFIENEKHLPGVPSAKELEEKGLSISDMQAIQMEKTEELFLYNIQLKNEMDEMQKELQEIKKQNTELLKLLKNK